MKLQKIPIIIPHFSPRAYHQNEAQTLSYLTSLRFRRIIAQTHENLGKTVLTSKKISPKIFQHLMFPPEFHSNQQAVE
jgi:hypothetical protein